MSRRARRTTRTAAAALVVALGAAACTSDGGSDAGPASDPSTTPSERTVVTQVSFGKLTGQLPADARQRLSDQVGDVVDGWIDAAYVGGDYPRRDFADSWPGFTAGARDEAHHDRALMSNEDIGATIDGVHATRRRVRIDVLTVKQLPVGVTAHVQLVFTTSGTPAEDVRVKGRLYLTPTEQGWQVFGYDVTKGDA